MIKLDFDQSWIIFKSDIWTSWKPIDLVYFQLNQRYLCVGIKKFDKYFSRLTKKGKYNILYDHKRKDEYIQILIDKYNYIPPSFRELVPRKLRLLLKDPEGGFKVQDYALKIKGYA